MTTMPSLRVVGLADPPATSVVEVDTEVSLMLSLCYAEPPTGPGFPLHLAVIPVGDAGLGATIHRSIWSRSGPETNSRSRGGGPSPSASSRAGRRLRTPAEPPLPRRLRA